MTKRTDGAGRATVYEYDAAGRLKKVTDAAQQATQFEYDALSRQTAVVDAIGQRYEFVYDAVGRVTEQRRAGVSMTFAYDGVGNRTRRTDYNGAATTYAYDPLSRMATISYPDATTVTYAYDKLSRLTAATNTNGTVTLGYDNAGRLSGATDVWGRAVGYTYDANGNRAQMSLGGVPKASYEYDSLNRLTRITDGAGAAVTYGYDATGKVTSRLTPNGVTASYQYDGLDRLTRLTHAKGISTIADYQYQQNAAGQITQIADQAGINTYAYDAVDRLTSATRPAVPAESYAYDAVGNRTASHRSSTYQYQPTNRVVTVGSATYAYDANGNLTSKTDAAGAWAYSWDYENRLVRVDVPGGASVAYKYDALGRRIQRAPGAGASTSYTYDGADVVLDVNSDGGTVEYLNGPGIDDKLRQASSTSGTHYFVTDHLGSTRALTDGSGNVVESIDYDSFGDGAGSARTRYGYTGRELDSLTGLYYYRARWYDPQQGRFISEDPIGLAGGINLHTYVDNSPVRFTDSSGLCPENSQSPNNRLAKCYADALEAYRAGTRNLSTASNVVRNFSPLSIPGSLNAAGGAAAGYRTPVSRTLMTRGADLIPGSRTGTLSGTIRGAAGGLLGVTGVQAIARLNAALAIGGAGIQLADAAFGPEAFLRNALLECNAGVPNATNIVVPSFIQNPLGSGNAGAAQDYIDQYSR